MSQPTYLTRGIDSVLFEIMPDASLVIHQRNGERIVLDPVQFHAIYLLVRSPGVAPLLRKADDERQRRLYEARYADGEN